MDDDHDQNSGLNRNRNDRNRNGIEFIEWERIGWVPNFLTVLCLEQVDLR